MLGFSPLGGAPLGSAGSSSGGPKTVYGQGGVYAIVGASASFSAGYSLSIDPAVYATVGSDATMTVPVRTINLAMGGYSYVADASVADDRVLRAEAGRYFSIGGQVALQPGFSMRAAQGTYTLTGAVGTFVRNPILLAGLATYRSAGVVAAKPYRKVIAETVPYQLTVSDATFSAGFTMRAETGSYRMDGATKLMAQRRTLPLSTAYQLAGSDVLLYATHGFKLGRASYRADGQPATLVRGRAVAVAGAYVLTGRDATLKIARTMAAARAVYTLNGNVSAAWDHSLVINSGVLALVGNPVTLTKSKRRIMLDNGAVHLVGGVATFFVGRGIKCDPAYYTLISSVTSLLGGVATSLQPGQRWVVDTVIGVASAGTLLVQVPPRNGIALAVGSYRMSGQAQTVLARIAKLQPGAYHSQGAIAVLAKGLHL